MFTPLPITNYQWDDFVATVAKLLHLDLGYLTSTSKEIELIGQN
jgi:hypothetical protein